MRATKNRSLTTARTRGDGSPAGASAGLLSRRAYAKPVPGPRGDVAERPHVGDTIDIDDAVQMVGLVLDHPGEEVLGRHAHRIALAIEAFQTNGGIARHH